MKDYFMFLKRRPLWYFFNFVWWTFISWLIVIWILKGSWFIAGFNAFCFGMWLFSHVHEYLYWLRTKQAMDEFLDELVKATKKVMERKES